VIAKYVDKTDSPRQRLDRSSFFAMVEQIFVFDIDNPSTEKRFYF
jgi:hypothetical protein